MQNPLITVDCTGKSLLYVFIFYFMYISIWLQVCTYVYHVMPGIRAVRRGHWVPWDWSDGQQCTTTLWVLEINPGPPRVMSARTAESSF